MAHVGARAQVTVDNPHAAGRISAFSFQRDWTYAPSSRREDDAYGGATGQSAIHSGTEYLDAMHCLKPKPILYPGDMTGLWDIVQGNWRLTSPSVMSPRAVWMDYYESGPQHWGQIQSKGEASCSVGLAIIRDALPQDTEEYPRYVGITFMGSTEQDSFRSFNFIFPYGMKSEPHPYVLDKLASENGEGNRVQTWELSDGHGIKLDKDTKVEFLTFEMLDGCMVVRHSDVDKAFIYQPYERSDWRFDHYGAFSRGKIKVTVYGHAAMVYCSALNYPITSNAVGQPPQMLSDLYYDDETEIKHHAHGWSPDSSWIIVTTENAVLIGGLGFEPRTAFVHWGVDLPQECPVNYVTTLDIMSTHAAAVSAPDVLEGQKIVRSLEYSINLKGRGQTCTVVVDDPTGAKALAWKGQNLVTVKCGFDDVTPRQKFMGYLGEKGEITRQGGDTVGRTSYKLDLQDPVDARLTAKFMLDRSAAGYENLAIWVRRLLYDAGEPAAYLTDILALTTGTLKDVIIPGSHGAKDLAHDFESTVSVPDALDKVTGSLGYSWGWNSETGQWFLRPTAYPRPAYPFFPDWTLDIEAAVYGGQYALNIKHIRSQHEFRNFLYLIAKTAGGAEACNLWMDRNSLDVAAASNFVGTDLWEVLKETDLASALARGAARWAELQQLPSVISWDMAQAMVGLGPGQIVEAAVDKMGIADSALYRIVEEKGSQSGEPSLNYQQSFVAEFVSPMPTAP